MEINKIYNQDCLVGMKNIPDESVDIIVTDPPYNVNFIPQRGTFDAILNDNMNWEEFGKFMVPVMKECFRVLKNDSAAYFFTGYSSSASYFYNFAKESGFDIKCQIVWVKNNFGIGYHIRMMHEDIWLCFKGKPKVPEKAMISVVYENKVQSLRHSCEKPIPLLRKLILQYSKEGDLVLDPFIGVGSTAVAAKELRRKYLGFEIDPNFVGIANERLKQENVSRWF